jgi:hypothetical protein
MTESRSYFGVCCARCGRLVVVSAEAVAPQHEIAQREANTHHLFVAKCKRCGFEGPYTVRPSQRFDLESCER